MTTQGTKSAFWKKLKSSCKKCTENSIKTYFRNITRLYRLVHKEEEVPANAKWLSNKKMYEAYKKIDLNKRRHLAIAGWKVAQTFGVEESDAGKKWKLAMLEDASKYQAHRAKNQKSEKEEKLWPKGGYSAIKKASSELLKRIKHAIAGEPTLATLYRYQMYIALKLYAEIPLRNTLASVQIEKNENANYLDMPKKGSAKLVIRKHKTSKQIGEKIIPVSRGRTTAIRKFLKYRAQLDLEHDFLLSNKSGKPLSKPAFGKALQRVTGDILGKKIGSRLIRVRAATASADVIKAAADLSNKLMHSESGKQTKLYVRKE